MIDDMYRVEILQNSLFNTEISVGNVDYYLNRLYNNDWEYVDNITCAGGDYVLLIFKRRTNKKDLD